jgi:REP element-mobilizing transposase RayT
LENPNLKKKLCDRHLWSRDKFFRNVGAVTTEEVEYYIKESYTGGVFSKTGQTSLENHIAK